MSVSVVRRRPQAPALYRIVAEVARLASALSIGMLLLWPSPLAVRAATVKDSTYFFRLTSKYMHGDEPVEFDIVVGCGVRVTLSNAVGSSYDAFRDPLFYVKATKDGAAVLQIVPDACQGQTTDNGRVPKDFLPGAIWFDKKDDFLLGVAYIAEDAIREPEGETEVPRGRHPPGDSGRVGGVPADQCTEPAIAKVVFAPSRPPSDRGSQGALVGPEETVRMATFLQL